MHLVKLEKGAKDLGCHRASLRLLLFFHCELQFDSVQIALVEIGVQVPKLEHADLTDDGF